jgi:hypothetical protein
MHLNLLRRTRWLPFTPAILERPHQFLLQCVHRNDRLLTLLLKPHHRGTYKLELSIAVRMRFSLFRLAIALQAVSVRDQQPSYRWGLTGCPFWLNSSARLAVLLHVHRNGEQGSSRVSGSTSHSKVSVNQGSASLRRFRRPPSLRKRESMTTWGLLSRIVSSANPLRIQMRRTLASLIRLPAQWRLFCFGDTGSKCFLSSQIRPSARPSSHS